MIITGQTGVAAPGRGERASYRNPVSADFADTFADPSVIQAKDGWWYAYATADPLRAGEKPGDMHVARTKDWSHWEYLGTIFDAANRPSYATDAAGLWAPDIRYIDGQYVLYYAVTDTTLHDDENAAIGVATADDPAGPWTPADKPIIPPRKHSSSGDFMGTIDPAGFTGADGQNYLYFGGYDGGVWGTKVSPDGLTAEEDYTRITTDDRYEGGYVIRHDGWYYFMASTANCCAGPATGYSVYSGRSRSPLGPFVDADGQSLTDPYVGGTNMVTQNGNRWIGAGHHAIATDTQGQDWMVYHAIDRDKPWLNEPFGINRRPMLIDPIDWIDGWPRVRAGAGPSQGDRAAPATGSKLGITPEDPAASGTIGFTQAATDPQSGAAAQLAGSARTRQRAPGGGVRLGVDLGRMGKDSMTVQLGSRDSRVEVTVDPTRNTLTVRTHAHGTTRVRSDDLPAHLLNRSGWRHLTVQAEQSRVRAWLGESGLSDPAGEVRLRHKNLQLRAAPVRFRSRQARLDNLTVQTVSRRAKRPAPTPHRGPMLSAEEFTDPALPDWEWVRRDPKAAVEHGRLTWPVQDGELVGNDNDAGVLLHRRLPRASGTDWMVETKFDLDLGEDELRDFQQAGLVAYRGDDDFARLSKVAIQKTRQVEYGRELAATPTGKTSWGGAIQARPGSGATWFRLAHHRNADGEHLFRAAVSRDGQTWTWGSVWTFAPGSVPRIGLISQGGAKPETDAIFDYVRFYQASWSGTDPPADGRSDAG